VKAVTLLVTPEQAEKLALAASEGKLQLVMRTSIDQGDEKTPGINKRGLLGGERAVPAPEPGSLKSERLEPKPAPRRARVQGAASSTPVTAPVAQAPRASVEMIEGGKKRSVDFPQWDKRTKSKFDKRRLLDQPQLKEQEIMQSRSTVTRLSRLLLASLTIVIVNFAALGQENSYKASFKQNKDAVAVNVLVGQSRVINFDKPVGRFSV
jgi:hypothetical protein